MLETADNLKGLEIYTPNGVFVGVVDEIILNVSEMKAESLFVNSANPALVDDNVSIAIPMRWVQSVGDIIILNAFPERVNKPVKE
ncbi:MAG: PRC-barrel domain-containing protein [Candidatus Methanomethylophilaceae archaeon]|nr:PRC-barrel domain-containing protein [Candidatus Methanomethylophilaceae archaeon]MDD3378872.1 PRC-barrel domain-containing protein [Candidatus Methanomethylophilaceae archaeon]